MYSTCAGWFISPRSPFITRGNAYLIGESDNVVPHKDCEAGQSNILWQRLQSIRGASGRQVSIRRTFVVVLWGIVLARVSDHWHVGGAYE